MPRHNDFRLAEAVGDDTFVSIQWSVDRRRMKRLLRLVLWLFLRLAQQKITVAIPLRNKPRQHVVSPVPAPDSPSIGCPCDGPPEEVSGSPADVGSLARRPLPRQPQSKRRAAIAEMRRGNAARAAANRAHSSRVRWKTKWHICNLRRSQNQQNAALRPQSNSPGCSQ